MPDIWVDAQGGIKLTRGGRRARIREGLRRPNLVRAIGIAVMSGAASFTLHRLTVDEPSLWVFVPIPFCTLSILDTVRCLRKRWDLYHGGVLLFLYAELMLLVLEATLAVLPFLFATNR